MPEALLEGIRSHSGSLARNVRIEAQRSSEAALLDLPMGVVLADPEPAATFRRAARPGGASTITYHPELLSRPGALVAILAHGLSHHLLANASSEPPGGVEAWDHATDLVAVALGYGVFLANASTLVTWEEGPTWEGPCALHQGWLSQSEVCEALALFSGLHRVPFRVFRRHLCPGARAHLRRHRRSLARSSHLQALQAAA